MKKIECVYLLLLCWLPLAYSQTTASKFFVEVDAFLKKYVNEGRVNYAAIKQNSTEIKALVSVLNQFDLKNLPDANTELAFWINAYNILVIQAVVANYPIQSPMDVKGFFDTQKHIVAGELLTLNDIENKKVREKFKDARIHFALVCAARSCPPIINEAYFGDKLNVQLNARTRTNLNDPKFIRVDKTAKKAYLSEIFRWYERDFTATGKSALEYINQFRTEKIPNSYAVDYYKYDWSLNEYK